MPLKFCIEIFQNATIIQNISQFIALYIGHCIGKFQSISNFRLNGYHNLLFVFAKLILPTKINLKQSQRFRSTQARHIFEKRQIIDKKGQKQTRLLVSERNPECSDCLLRFMEQ